ncbi:MAG: AbrB/MazE/SpoVT family DNA-binding domain-containing protein [Anaerolineae bacterium]|nr:AbrB/MazE/SpoVT family DNA-binding domain-containing protein [Phycisphaerae bacterium]
MASATLTSKWQMVIPKPVREHLGVQPGDQLEFVIQGNGQVVVRTSVLDVRQLKGALVRPGRKPVSIQRMNQAIRRRAKRSAA